MADFKLCIADPKSGKSYQKEAKDKEGSSFIGKNIGDTIKGETIGLTGYEFMISGGSDNCGFPMRKGILGVRKQLNLLGGIGLRKNFSKGIKKRKTVCGHKITQNIVQINLKITKQGAKKPEEAFGAGEAPKEDAKAGKPKEEKAEKSKEKKPKKEEVKETPKEEPKAEEKKEAPKEEKKE